MHAPLPRLASFLVLACAAPLVRAGDPVKGGDELPPLPVLVSLDPANFDHTANPCTDIYTFVNGGWIAHNPVPPEYGRWGAGHEVTERNQRVLRTILEDAAAKTDAPRGSVDQLLGDFWCACM